MDKLVIYVHGKGGNSLEAEHYKNAFKNYKVIGFDYKSETPWEAKKEFFDYFEKYQNKDLIIVANSFGAYLVLNSLNSVNLQKAFFISPVVDMETLILTMLKQNNITENELKSKKEIVLNSGEKLSWEYLSYVRTNPIIWNKKTYIIYGENDFITPKNIIKSFAKKIKSKLKIIKNGNHWFHTKEDMDSIYNWIRENLL